MSSENHTLKNCSKYLFNKWPCSISTQFISMVTFIGLKESNKNLANSNMKEKNFVPIVGFVELLLLSNCCKVDNAWSSQICASLAQYLNLSCLKSTTNYSCNGHILVVSNGGYDLRPQEHPFVDKHFRFDHFQSFGYGMFHLVYICHGYPGSPSSCSSIPCLPASYRIGVSEVDLSLCSSEEWKRGPSCT